jgi:hypothetical protein
MSQIARGYDKFQSLSAEVLEIGLSTPDRARLYAQKFPIPFPYLCDPDYRVRREWRLGDRRHTLRWYVSNALKEIRLEEPRSDFGALGTTPGDFAVKLYDVDMGFFIVDREGIVRYSLAGAYGDFDTMQLRAIPSNDEIVRELERLSAQQPRG